MKETKEVYEQLHKFHDKEIVLGTKMENTCPLCHTNSFHVQYHLQDFDVLQCRSCGLKIRDHIPDKKQLSSFYNKKDYWDTPYFSNCFAQYDSSRLEIQAYQHVLDFLNSLSLSGAILDVGCATGVFLDLAQKGGWKTMGVEISEYAASYGRNHFKLDIHTGTLDNISLAPSSFDVVTSFEVVEHVDDPISFVQKSAILVKSGGYLVLMTPDHSSLIAFVAHVLYRLSFGKFTVPVYGIYDIEHIVYFTPKTLRKLVEPFGFKEVKILKESLDLERSKEVQSGIYLVGMKILIFFSKLIGKEFKFTSVYQKLSY